MMPPILLHYYITERCNCRCAICDIWQKPSSGDARLPQVVENLKSAKRLGVRFVDFTGGEPLLHDDLPAMLTAAKKLGLQTSVTTNGVRYAQFAEQLAGRVDYLHFSLDALDESRHNALRGRGLFRRVMENIDLARQLRETPDLLFTVTENNLDQLAPLVGFAQALGLMLIVNPFFSYALPHRPQSELLQQIERFAAAPFVYLNPAFHRLRRQGGNQRSAPRCRAVSSTLVVSPDNHLLLPCYHFCRQRLPIPPTPGGLLQARKTALEGRFARGQGRFSFCQGCHLNCYADPSFLYVIDDFFWESSAAKLRYARDKYFRRRLFRRRFDPRPALEIAQELMRRS